MGAIVLDGAEIGDNVIIAAGSLVPPGKKISSNTLVMGSPAKVVRELTKESMNIKTSADYYVKLAREHSNMVSSEKLDKISKYIRKNVRLKIYMEAKGKMEFTIDQRNLVSWIK